MAIGVTSYNENDILGLNVSNTYNVYNFKFNLLKGVKKNVVSIIEMGKTNSLRVLSQLHIQNSFDGIRKDVSLNAEIEREHESTLFVHLRNIAQRIENISLNIHSASGHIIGDDEAN